MGHKKNKKRSLSETNQPQKIVTSNESIEVKKKKQKPENTTQNGQPPMKKIKTEITKDSNASVSKKLSKSKKEKETVLKTKDNNEKSSVKLFKKKGKKGLQNPQENEELKKTYGKMAYRLLKLSVEELKNKIQLIESRDTITKTGRRKLAKYKKYLDVVEKKAGSQSDSNIITESEIFLKKNKKQLSESSINDNKTKSKVQRMENVDKALKSKKEVNEVKDVIQTQKKQEKKKDKIQSNEFVKPQKKKPVDDHDDDDDDEDEDEEDEEEDNNDLNDKNVEEEEDEEENEDVDEDEDEGIEDVKINTEKKLKQDADDDDDDNDDDDDDEEEDDDNENSDEEGKIKKKAPTQAPKKKRYVLFVANLPYDIKDEDIKQHFLTKASTITDVRIPKDPKTKKPRGFAYVELPDQANYEKAFSLNKSFLNGRRINVQYTAGGSNKKAVIVAKNKKLAALQKAGKLAGSKKPGKKQTQKKAMNV